MDERELYTARLGELLHAAFVRIRANSVLPEEVKEETGKEISDLADLLHNIPRWMVGHDDHAIDSAEQFRDAVADHVRRFFPAINPDDHMYLRILDMSPSEFEDRYQRKSWHWPEPAAVPA